jgi:hypothetical protein
MAEMTAADFRKLADEREAAGDIKGANRARDRANAIDQKNLKADQKAGKMMKSGGMAKYKKGGMPDLTGDGKVTRADVLKGRGVFKKGGMTKSYAIGGKVDGCAVRGKTRGRTV